MEHTQFPQIDNDAESIEIMNAFGHHFFDYLTQYQKTSAKNLVELSLKGNKKAGEILLFLLEKKDIAPPLAKDSLDLEVELFLGSTKNCKDLGHYCLKWSEFNIKENTQKKFVEFECEILFLEEVSQGSIENRYLSTNMWTPLTKEIIKSVLTPWLNEKNFKLRQHDSQKNKGHYYPSTLGLQIVKGRVDPQNNGRRLVKQAKQMFTYEILPIN